MSSLYHTLGLDELENLPDDVKYVIKQATVSMLYVGLLSALASWVFYRRWRRDFLEHDRRFLGIPITDIQARLKHQERTEELLERLEEGETIQWVGKPSGPRAISSIKSLYIVYQISFWAIMIINFVLIKAGWYPFFSFVNVAITLIVLDSIRRYKYRYENMTYILTDRRATGWILPEFREHIGGDPEIDDYWFKDIGKVLVKTYDQDSKSIILARKTVKTKRGEETLLFGFSFLAPKEFEHIKPIFDKVVEDNKSSRAKRTSK